MFGASILSITLKLDDRDRIVKDNCNAAVCGMAIKSPIGFVFVMIFFLHYIEPARSPFNRRTWKYCILLFSLIGFPAKKNQCKQFVNMLIENWMWLWPCAIKIPRNSHSKSLKVSQQNEI